MMVTHVALHIFISHDNPMIVIYSGIICTNKEIETIHWLTHLHEIYIHIHFV